MKDTKKIYKRFIRDLPTTLLFSLTITIGVFLVYLICVAIFANGAFASLATDIFGQLLVITTIAMIIGLVSPFIYSFFACNGVLNTPKKDDVRYKSFLKTYMIGTRPPFNGQLRIWNTLLNSFLIYLGIDLLALLFLSTFAQAEGSPFKPLFDELTALNMNDANYFGQVEVILMSYKELLRTTALFTSFFSLLFSSYYFLHTVSKNTIRYFLAPSLMNAPTRLVTFVYRLTMRSHRKEYNKAYYKTLWPLTVLFVATFSLSYFLIGLLGPVTMELPLLHLTSIFISVAVLLPFLPLLFNFHESLWPEYSKYFLDTFINGATRELNIAKERLKDTQGDQYKQLDAATQGLEKIKELMEAKKEEINEELNKDTQTENKEVTTSNEMDKEIDKKDDEK